LHPAVGRAEGERIVEMASRALDEAGGDRHPPLPAPAAEMGEGGTIRSLAVRREIREEPVTGVEQLGQYGQLDPVTMRLAQQLVGSVHVRRDVERIGGYLERSHHDLHGRAPRPVEPSIPNLALR